MMTIALHGEGGHVTALEAVRVDAKLQAIPGTNVLLPCDLVLLAMGFLGPITDDIVAQLGCALDRRGNVAVTDSATSVPGVFAAGDMARGQRLVVWAIAEGRRAAAAVERYLGRSIVRRAAGA